jgi:hypothetical protein
LIPSLGRLKDSSIIKRQFINYHEDISTQVVREHRRYIHTIEFKEEDFEEAVATNPDEIRALGKAGWQKYDETTFSRVQMHFYRKPKGFGRITKC